MYLSPTPPLPPSPVELEIHQHLGRKSSLPFSLLKFQTKFSKIEITSAAVTRWNKIPAKNKNSISTLQCILYMYRYLYTYLAERCMRHFNSTEMSLIVLFQPNNHTALVNFLIRPKVFTALAINFRAHNFTADFPRWNDWPIYNNSFGG